MNTSITFSTKPSLKTMIEENAAKRSTSVSAYLTELIQKVLANDKQATKPREHALSERVRKYMGIVKGADGDWKDARCEYLKQKYGI